MPSGRQRAVFFDVGGTLSFAEPSGDEIWAAALEEHGCDITREGLSRATGVIGPEFNRLDIVRALQGASEALAEDVPSTPEEERAYFRRYDAMVLERLSIPVSDEIMDTVDRRFQEDVVVHVYDDAESALETLQAAGYRLGVISNATHDIPARLEELGLARYFEAIIYSFEVGVEKPHPGIFIRALERLGVRASEAAHVGDSYEADVVGARQVGITPMLIVRDGSPSAGDCIVLHSLREVTDHL